MASSPIPFLERFPPARAGRIAAVLLNKHSAREIAEAVEIMVDVLDLIGGDPDLEDDDPSGQCDEDGINTDLTWQWGGGPGCSISDAPEDDDPGGGNVIDEPHDAHDEGF